MPLARSHTRGRARPRARVAITFALALAFAGCRSSGDPCTRNEACGDGGVCLKGACAAYPCMTDEECEEDQVCGRIGGNSVCVLPCEDDDACPGDQTCEVPSDAADGERYCL
ncbi:MAG: hypothetical protein H6710_13490 [Myxococcales bacterium]|nr:hypothetical protein [Myxococcales bacterium]MCB9705423.1 hypothetical protein [Myxococcales bacterium]